MAAIPPTLRHAATRDWQQMLNAASDNPADLLAVEQESGFTTLHRAIAGGAPDSVIEALLTSNEGRQATLIRCREGSWTPLHLSCRAIATDATIMTIAISNTAAISVQDDDGDNALHSALRNGASDLVLQTLIGLAAGISHGNDIDNESNNSLSDTPGENNPTSCTFQTPDHGDGDWPVHSAIRHEAPAHIVELLLDASPESIDARNNEWKAPLHIACEFERHDIIALLIQRVTHWAGLPTGFRSYLATEDWFGSTPVDCLWERYLNNICASDDEGDHNDGDSDASLHLCQTVEQIEIWESIVLLLTSAYYGREVDFDPRYRSRSQVQLLIQAAIGLGSVCPPMLLSFLVKRYPLVLSTPDSRGRLPLHDAIIQAGTSSAPSPLPRHQDVSNHAARPVNIAPGTGRSEQLANSSASPLGSGTLEFSPKASKHDQEYDIIHPAPNPVHFHPSSYSDEPTSALEVLIHAYPPSTTHQDAEGHLPLALAALSGLRWNQGTESLFKAYPNALRVRDKKTGLYPFMLAATSEVTDDAAQIDTIFQLLRLEPSVVSSGIIENKNHSPVLKRKAEISDDDDSKKKQCTRRS